MLTQCQKVMNKIDIFKMLGTKLTLRVKVRDQICNLSYIFVVLNYG